ncbi:MULTISPECIES: adenine deaminase [Methanosphaera]|jgi:adenine deaminase|uniref:Adenine deaminase n=3 Tax=Methanosphaera stadtmanae TaxID=2317 RepID=ADEC_METST|nr:MULTISPECIES: adenine deaminase [Methanosphaera]Q2NER8.1 RecName: Full=Adenine deaminase; Short=Adenase; Short=Adenine aminase [Methanosphaera stadtmanae DSM 3091]ABC57685.1 adenine deaminase [Methanosphaera stadtmanae DSM 3091]MDO5821467.1 adenine deaminase [Methanosphaera sp.]OEC91568.1 adenine deaminase [Methanosphaera sp. A6]RAP02607.1 adenine deaminase [Methanosphaera stadtmanae]RAP46558.1 MAG: adenine deaminase [Methanosphaera sp. DEW79]
MLIKGNILNVFTDEIYPGEIKIEHGIIESIKEVNADFNDIIVPGFIDAHIHIESSMLTPSRFAEIALRHGTTSVIADPHEIANVMGMDGIDYMIDDAKKTPLKYYFTAPSCVPATKFEKSGATISPNIIDNLLSRPEFVALGEVMDYNAVISNEKSILEKIKIAKKYHKPIDGHAPLLSGKNLQKYVKHGVITDHESTTKKEVAEKKRMGMKIMIREGSESKMLEKLIYSNCDFIVSDDLKPEDLINGHLDKCLRKAVDYGMDPYEAIKLVTINPAEHYNLNAGSISPGKSADLVFIDNLRDFTVKRVVINGNTIFKKQKLLFRANPRPIDTTLHVSLTKPEDFDLKAQNPAHKSATVNLINVSDNTIITKQSSAKLSIQKKTIIPSVFEDILKISVVDRYGGNTISNGFVKGFGIKNGAIASSVSHDSHNIIVVGTNSEYMSRATNHLIENKGGLAAISNQAKLDVTLPIAGLMSDKPAKVVANNSAKLNELVSNMGCELSSPFTSLSFMALPVVPEVKMTTNGLFNVNTHQFIDIIKEEK